MNNYYTPSAPKVVIYGIAIICAFLIMGFMVRRMYRQYDPGRVNSARAAERIKARKELEVATAEVLTKAGWVDQDKGLVRLPIDRAMQLTIQQSQNQAVFHSNLVARAKVAAAPAPAKPEKPSEFE